MVWNSGLSPGTAPAPPRLSSPAGARCADKSLASAGTLPSGLQPNPAGSVTEHLWNLDAGRGHHQLKPPLSSLLPSPLTPFPTGLSKTLLLKHLSGTSPTSPSTPFTWSILWPPGLVWSLASLLHKGLLSFLCRVFSHPPLSALAPLLSHSTPSHGAASPAHLPLARNTSAQDSPSGLELQTTQDCQNLPLPWDKMRAADPPTVQSDMTVLLTQERMAEFAARGPVVLQIKSHHHHHSGLIQSQLTKWSCSPARTMK